MPSKPIQGYPLGFLSLLGLKNLGKLPDTLIDEVRGTFDLQEWYLRGAKEVVVPAVTVAATGGTQSIAVAGSLVPEGEAWYIHNFGVHVFCAAPPATFDWWVELLIVDRNGFYRSGVTRTVPLSAAGGCSLMTMLQNFWLYTGERLQIVLTLGVGDTIDLAQIDGTKVKV